MRTLNPRSRHRPLPGIPPRRPPLALVHGEPPVAARCDAAPAADGDGPPRRELDRSRPSLAAHLPAPGTAAPDEVLSRFLDWVAETGLEPYPAQEEALLELMGGKHVILNTPTGSGKSLVALALHFKALARGTLVLLHLADQGAGEREVLLAVRRPRPGARRHADRRRVDQPRGARSSAAPPRCSPTWRCATAPTSTCRYVVMDEFHYYADAERGVAWQVPLITLPRDPLPAHVGDPRRRARRSPRRWRRETGVEVAAVRSVEPPGAARLRVPRDAAPRDRRGAGGGRPRAGLHRQLHPAASAPSWRRR